MPLGSEPPATNFAAFVSRNNDWVLAFDQTTQEAAVWKAVLPRNYAGGGITVYLTWAAVPTTGTVGWDVAFERIGDGSQDIDADGFATAKVVTAATVPGTSGNTDITNVAFTNSEIDGLVVGEVFRLRVRRDVATDTAAGDAQLLAVELKET
jgi:hypothetical protein